MKNLVKGLLIEVRPLPTVAAITAGIVGFLLSGAHPLNTSQILLYSAAIFLVMLTVHIHDTYVDYYVRGEDKIYDFGLLDSSNDLISKQQMKLVILLASTGYFLLTALLSIAGGLIFASLATIGWAVGLLYTPYLDRNPILSSFTYPFGMMLTIIGASYLARNSLSLIILFYSFALMLCLGGAKIVEDLIDMEHDPVFGKATVATRLGFERAKRAGYAIVLLGLSLLAYASITNLLPATILVGVAIAGVTAACSYRLKPIRGVYILVAGLYAVMIATLIAI